MIPSLDKSTNLHLLSEDRKTKRREQLKKNSGSLAHLTEQLMCPETGSIEDTPILKERRVTRDRVLGSPYKEPDHKKDQILRKEKSLEESEEKPEKKKNKSSSGSLKGRLLHTHLLSRSGKHSTKTPAPTSKKRSRKGNTFSIATLTHLIIY